MRIGELAAAAGVSVRALRYYEEQGLLASRRSAGGHRHYPESAADQVWLIQQFYAAGLSSKAILAIMPCIETGEVTPEALALLVAERDRIDRQVEGLASARDRLDTIITTAGTPSCTGHPYRPAG
ncbi:MerR family transcriptional regulator [Amycolatopsis samaneae]|uniref:MerR family transcriptional regulator n=1 Tax=Amycolatopsis samaneae TaxID=664691 RepID=A0ABW5GNE3_9PSEU